MEFPDIWMVMKWVLLVLLAGFVGQFGKTFAQQVMKRLRKEPKPPVGAAGESGKTLPATLPVDVRQPAVLPGARPGAPLPTPTPPAGTAPPPADKKLMKALAKQKKKEAKALQKADKG